MVRVFVGINIPEDIKRYVTGIQTQLKTFPATMKFVEPENLHISLSFLGDVNESELGNIKSKLDEICALHASFEVALGDIQLIPNKNFMRVVALDAIGENLESLRKEIVKAVGGESHPTHLTLARIGNVTNKNDFIRSVEKIVCNKQTVRVDTIYLIKSELQRNGPVYTKLHGSRLK